MASRRVFLAAGLGVCATLRTPTQAQAAATDTTEFMAGAGRADVALGAELFPLDGFARQHDPLAVRVLLLDDGRKRMAIVVVDLTSISDDMVSGLKTILSEVAGVPADNAIVCASHTFSAPHVFTGQQLPPGTDASRNGAALRAIDSALRDAAAQAVNGLRPARLGCGTGASRVGVNRDMPTPRGWWIGANDAGFTDPAVGVLRIDDRSGRPIAIAMNVAVQASILDGSTDAQGGRVISADLAGAAARHVEAWYGAGTAALFLVGAAGDQAPYLQSRRHVVNDDGSVGQVDIHEGGYMLLALLGERLGNEVIRVADGIKTGSGSKLQLQRELVTVRTQNLSPRNAPAGPVTTFDYSPGAMTTMPLVLMRLGDLVLVGVQPELSASIGAMIKAASPFAHTMVVTMVDGAAKYMPDAQGYDRFSYEARSSPYARGAAEAAATAVVDRLNQMNRFAD